MTLKYHMSYSLSTLWKRFFRIPTRLRKPLSKIMSSLALMPIRPSLLNGVVLLALPGDHVFEGIRQGNSFEPQEINFIRDFLLPGQTFWDVGANFGLYTLLAASLVTREGTVLAIEPEPKNRQRLKMNVWLNHQPQVTILPYALGEYEGESEFVSCAQGAYSGLKVAQVPGKIKKIRVQQSTLDVIADQKDWPKVDFLKMDVEGAELLVLRGGVKFFEKQVRPLVMAEFSDRRTIAFGHKAKEVYDWLWQREYRWFQLNVDGKLRPHTCLDIYDYDNLVACPTEKLEKLKGWIES